MSRFGFGIASALVAASVAAPLLVQHYAQHRLRDEAQKVRQIAGEVSRLKAENERLSTILASGHSLESLSTDQLQELLGLRNEIGTLRQQTNTIQQLREKNDHLRARSIVPADAKIIRTGPEEVSADTIAAMRSVLMELQPALQRFADDHNGKAPAGFYELRNYFPTEDGRRMTGLYTFELIRDEGPKPGDTLILRESTWRDVAGTVARVYGFGNGEVTEVRLPANTDEPEQSFQKWEQRHLASGSEGIKDSR